MLNELTGIPSCRGGEKNSDQAKKKGHGIIMSVIDCGTASERRGAMEMTGDKRDRDMVIPADWVPGPRQGRWTYEMYAALPEDGHRYEVVQGVLMMSPAPRSE